MLKYVKMLLGIADDDVDEARDKKIEFLIVGATARLKLLLGGIEPPEDMQHMIVDVAIARFNRIGSEGLKSHTVEGESLSFTDNDFDGFKDEIQAFLDTQNEGSGRGKVRFL